jgi:L-fuculose-phosphate aldolase
LSPSRPPSTLDQLKEDICEIGRRLYGNGYIAAMEGHASIRLGENEVMSTPAGVCKGYLTPSMIVTCDMDGRKLQGELRVSTEIQMHLAVYRARPDMRAVVHAHPPKSTGFAVAGVPLNKAVLAEVVGTLGCVPLAQYEDIYDAYYKMEVIEHFAEISLISRQLGGERLLPRQEVSRLLELRQKVYQLQGPPGGDACPVPAEGEGEGDGDEIRLTRRELVDLIAEAIREVDR